MTMSFTVSVRLKGLSPFVSGAVAAVVAGTGDVAPDGAAAEVVAVSLMGNTSIKRKFVQVVEAFANRQTTSTN